VKTIDINCDLGEGGRYDEALMPLITSCNIACGGHYGDVISVERAVELAKINNVNIGAHPSYPDFENFGRQTMEMSSRQLKKHLHGQIDLVEKACKIKKVKLHHIKPHGALYNDMRKNQAICDLILEVVIEREMDLILFVPPSVNFSLELPESIQLWLEGFADRAYNSDLSLVSRKEKDAVLHDPILISNRVLSMLNHHVVEALTGEKINVEFDTICVHSDTQNAVEILKKLRSNLDKNNVKVGV
jgi:UPF0271 protein